MKPTPGESIAEEVRHLTKTVTAQALVIQASKDPEGIEKKIEQFAENKDELYAGSPVRWDPVKVVTLQYNGVSFPDIVKIVDPDGSLGVTDKALQKFCERYGLQIDRKQVEVYKSARKDILNDLERKALEKLGGMIDSGHPSITLKDLSAAAGMIFDKRRLEEDKSTANIATKHSGVVDRIMEQRRKEYEEAPDGTN